MRFVWHLIDINRGEITCGTWPEKGIHIGRCCIHSYSITEAPAKLATHVSFWWCIKITTISAESTGDTYPICPMARVTEIMYFSVNQYENPLELSEPTGTPWSCCPKLEFWQFWVQELVHGVFNPCTFRDALSCFKIWSLKSRQSWHVAKLVHKLLYKDMKCKSKICQSIPLTT